MVYAVRYATLPDFPLSGLVAGADRSRKMDIAMMVWLLEGEGRISYSIPASTATNS